MYQLIVVHNIVKIFPMKNLFLVVVVMIVFLVTNRMQCKQPSTFYYKELQRVITNVNKSKNIKQEFSELLENFKKILLDKLEIAEEPKIKLKLSPAEREWARKTHEEIERKTDDQQQKLQIIYPQLLRIPDLSMKSKPSMTKLLFWLPLCHGFLCHISLLRIRLVLRVKQKLKQRFTYKKTMMTISFHLIDTQHEVKSKVAERTFLTPKHTEIEEFNLTENILDKMKTYTNKFGILISCDTCNLTHSPAVRAHRFGMQMSSLTILIREEKQLSVKHRQQKECFDCCRRNEYTVTLKDMGWDYWILVPRHAFRIGYCSGNCQDHRYYQYGSEYSYLSRMITHKNKTGINLPNTCCVPTEYERTTVMYSSPDSSGNLAVYQKAIKQISAKSCSCV